MTETRDIVDDLVAEIDRRLSLAHASLLLARAGRVRRPGAGAERACQAAETRLDDLLDQRLALSPRPLTSSMVRGGRRPAGPHPPVRS